MKFSLILNTCVLLACGAAACGPVVEEARLPTEQAELPNLADIPDGYYTTSQEDNELPLETFLVQGHRLNKRVRDQTVTFQFASNREDATYQCSVGSTESFKTCEGGDRLTLVGLRHGASYRVRARAVLASGQIDASALDVEIIADFINGGPLFLLDSPPQIPRRPIQSVSDLPYGGVTSGSGNVTPAEELPVQELLLGEEDLVIPPPGMVVASFSAAKSVAMNLLTFRLVDQPTGACELSWERLVQHPLGPWYCEGFPTESDLLALEKPMARNHVRLERHDDGMIVRESLYTATLAETEELVRADFAQETLCADARNQGSARGPRFSGIGSAVGSIQWCLVQRSSGSWWIASWDDGKSRADGSHLLAVYTAEARQSGFQSSEHFLRRARQFLTTVIVPSGQTRF